MYEVLTDFIDTITGHYYVKGDTYPKKGHSPSKDRIDYLCGKVESLDNKPAIKEIGGTKKPTRKTRKK